jgi:hypothetical protein
MSETWEPGGDVTWSFACTCGHVSKHAEGPAVVGMAQAHALGQHGSLIPDGVVIAGLRREPSEAEVEIAGRAHGVETGVREASSTESRRRRDR